MRVEARKGQLAGVILAAIAGSVLLAAPASAQQKTVKQCTDEWRANKADNQAKGITEKAFVAQCRAGGAAAAPTAAPTPTQAAKPAAAPAAAQQRTVKECTEEWRANKAQNQAKGITQKAFVAQCRSGTAAAQPTAAPTAAPPTQTSPSTAAAPAARTTPRTGGTTAVAPPGSADEAQARARCPSDTVVWVNEDSKIYHFSGHKAYGTTKQGKYMCEKDAVAAGDRAAKNEKHP